MCTVTILPINENDFVLTSNRDEAPNRLPFPPEFYTENSVSMLYPKDRLAGGTWIGISESKRLICLLNGGFGFHERKAEYRQSRGVVVKDLLASKHIEHAVELYNLEEIEPFTIIIADWNNGLKFYELVWSEGQKYFKSLPNEPQIWSSSTLYSDTMKEERKQWFKDFKQQNKLNKESIMRFHKSKSENYDYGFLMDRGFVKTTSITQVVKEGEEVKMNYQNLQDDSVVEKKFEVFQSVNE